MQGVSIYNSGIDAHINKEEIFGLTFDRKVKMQGGIDAHINKEDPRESSLLVDGPQPAHWAPLIAANTFPNKLLRTYAK